MRNITGQHPTLRRAKRSIARFDVRQGLLAGVMLTLREARMSELFDRPVTPVSYPHLTLPTICSV